MVNFCIEDIVKATKGKLLCGERRTLIDNCCTDSNKAEAGLMFVPVIGERVDGHRFMRGAFENGADAFLASNSGYAEELMDYWKSNGIAPRPIVLVDNTVSALQCIAKAYEASFTLKKIGVTGSVGKTTTKEMVACALNGLSVYKTAGNSNSQIGVPLTIMGMSPDKDIAVVEMGMSEKGEMEKLAGLLSLDAVVMTNIGVSHIENLGSRKNILDEKWHITDALNKSGPIFLNGDDDMLMERAGEFGQLPEYKGRIKIFGTNKACDYRAVNVRIKENGIIFDFEHWDKGNRIDKFDNVKLSVLGNHNVLNAVASMAVASYFGVSYDKSAEALAGYTGVAMRQQITKKNKITYIDDSYNASPDSMKAGLSVLSQTEASRRIAVLADMLELGDDSPKYHELVGNYVCDAGVDELVIFGNMSKYIGTGAKGCQKIVSFDTREEIVDYLKDNLRENDAVLFKGSRGMKLNEVVDALIK